MTPTDLAEAVLEDVLVALKDDWVGVWEVPWFLREIHGVHDPTETMEASLKVLSRFLQLPGAQLGVPTETGAFEPWGLSPQAALERVEYEWRTLGRSPDIGEIVWLNIVEPNNRCSRRGPAGRAADRQR